MSSQVIGLQPFQYVHVLDNNTFVSTLHCGPAMLTLQEHEQLVYGPEKMIVIPPTKYCRIGNPIVREDSGAPEKDEHGNNVLRHGESEYRFHQAPFPLYPGETLEQAVTDLTIVEVDHALRIECVQDFKDEEGEHRVAGDQWLFYGPGTYHPRVETITKEVIPSIIIQPNEALRLRAKRAFKDATGTNRVAGELWLYRTPGAYLPSLDEEVVARVKASTITELTALHLQATRDFTDDYGKERRVGEQWLVTRDIAESHIPHVCEAIIGQREMTVLNEMQYCVVLDPVDEKTGVPRFGERELRRGPAQFFLRPGEALDGDKTRNVEVMGSEEALLLQALSDTVDQDGKQRAAGEQWLIFGPGEYVPPGDVRIVASQQRIPLDENEGIYVRNRKTGDVRAVMGPQSYMLSAEEELWQKHLPAVVEDLLLRRSGGTTTRRNKTRVVTFRAPHNSAVQVYDYREQVARVLFGPDLVMLGPDEHFTVLSLSGGKPKKPHMIKDIALLLGPDFMTDYVVVETADHAKLELRLSYNYQFHAGKGMPEDQAHALFAVPDFVGDGCNAIASRVRAAVAQQPFDAFHRNSAHIIRAAVFGTGADGHVNERFVFNSNNLHITNIDIKAVEPVDHRTRDMLQKSVQLAIDITTKSVQLAAQHKAECEAQAAKGELGNLKILDATSVEEVKKRLIELRVQCSIEEKSGEGKAGAMAKAEATVIEAEADVNAAKLRSDARQHRYVAATDSQRDAQLQEIEFKSRMNEIEVKKATALADIEAQKFEALIKAIGSETIAEIARAGPEMQAKLLQGLGLQSFLITDGTSPINLFSVADGLVPQAQAAASK